MIDKLKHIVVMLGICCIPMFVFSQEQDAEEEKRLSFENAFFNALKYKAIGNHKEAIKYLEICRRIDSVNIAMNFEFSKNFLSLSREFEAFYFISRALEKDPENKWMLIHLKKIYLKAQNFKEAISVQKKLVEKDPNEYESLVHLYIQNNEKEKALELLEELEKNKAISFKLLQVKANLLKREEPRIKTEMRFQGLSNEALKKLFKTNKSFDILKFILINEHDKKDGEGLLYYSNQGIELFPAQPVVYLMKGVALNHQQKFKEAVSVLKSGIDFVIDNNVLEADFYDQLYISYKGLEQHTKAKESRERALKLRNKE